MATPTSSTPPVISPPLPSPSPPQSSPLPTAPDAPLAPKTPPQPPTDIPPSSSSPPPRTTISSPPPPYWHTTTTAATTSSTSLHHTLGAITLRDNEADTTDPRSAACWARAVRIVDYIIIDSTSTPSPSPSTHFSTPSPSHNHIAPLRLPGSFVTYTIHITTLSGASMTVSRRYSEFYNLRARLVRSFPGFEVAVPELPPKSVIARFRPAFLEKRRAGLEYFLNCILLNPEFSGSPVLKDFLFN